MGRTGDMTAGHPVKLILRFAVPLFIGNIFQQIYSMVDTMIAGYTLGDAAIGAIGATTSVYSLLINLAIGLNNGYAIVVSQAFGAKDREGLKRSLAAMAVLDAAASAVLTLASLLLIRPLMRLLQVPENIFADAHLYICVLIAGMAANVLYNMFAGIMRAVGNSRTPLYFLILACLLNLGLDVLFVVGFRWGVGGAAGATVIAQCCSALLSGLYVAARYRDLLPEREHFRLRLPVLRERASYGFSMAAMYCVVDMGSVLYQRAINGLGELLIVAHTSARRLISIFMLPLGSIATAYSTFVGQNWGAGRRDRVKQSLMSVMAMEVGWGVFSCAFIYLFGGAAVRLLTNTSDPEVLKNAVLSLRIHLVCYPALGILLALRTALQAMGHRIAPVISSLFELGIKIISGIWLIPAFGYLCACLTEPVIWTVCMVFLILIFWIRKPLDQE